MGALSPTHWLIIVGVLVLLFGAKRLPDAARSIGRSARILKAEVKEINPGANADTATDASAAEALPPVHVAPQNSTSTSGPHTVTQSSGAVTSTDGGDLAAVVGDHPGR